MKSNIIVTLIGAFLLLLFCGSLIVYHAISSDESFVNNQIESNDIDAEVNHTANSENDNNEKTNASNPNMPGNEKVKNRKDFSSDENTYKKPLVPSINNQNSKEVVVDQTLANTKNSPDLIKTSNIENTTESIQEKVEIEITVLNGLDNKILADFDIDAIGEFRGGYIKSGSFKTDKNGKFILTVGIIGSMFLKLNTADYSTHTRVMSVKYGKNEYRAKLLKGGTLEIKATSADNKPVEGLTAKFNTFFRAPTEKDSFPLTFDNVKGVYILNNVPLGAQDISFKAPGFLETEFYKVRVDVKNTSYLEVRLYGTKMLYFDLNIPKKPDLIFVTNLKRANTTVKSPEYNVSTRLPSRVSNQTHIPNKIEIKQDRLESFKNQNGLFEFELTEKSITNLTLDVDGYVPKEITITPNSDTYKIILMEGFTGKLQIKNEKNEPIAGATVTYTSGLLNQISVSNEKGEAELSGMTKSMWLQLAVVHPKYASWNEKWHFDSEEQNTKIIVLKEGKGISGKIKFEDKAVSGAIVTLMQAGKPAPIATMTTGADGAYFFNKIEGKSDILYVVSAIHSERGVATSAPTAISEKNITIDLVLVNEKSITVKVVDERGEPLHNKKVNIISDLNNEYAFSVATNEKGEAELFNINRGTYTVILDDSKYRCTPAKTTIPAGLVTLTAKKKNLKKVNITVSDGKPFSGELKVTLERNDWPIEVTVDEDGYFVEFNDSIVFVIVVFQAQGYGSVRLGPYQNAENFPKEFNVHFKPGENFKVKVIDDADLQPIPYVTVEIIESGIKIEALPTNELGEINFSHIGGRFFVLVTDQSYAKFSTEFDGSQAKETTIRLVKGGSLKGHLTLKKEVAKAKIMLEPGTENSAIDSAGNFEILNLLPGEYTISVVRTFKDGRTQIEKIPARIIIEREKQFEIDLDDFQKNQTTLEVSILKNGSNSNERGYLNITDRRHQSVIATEIIDGKYLVERILPGDYLISYSFQGKTMQKNLEILPNQMNTVEIIVPGSSVTFSVKNAEGLAISKVMVTLYSGEKFKQEDTYLGNQMITNPQGMGTFTLMPKTPYYFVVEEDFRFNYQINVVGPIVLEAGQDSRIDFVLPYARKLPKLQVVDQAGKVLADAGFLFTDEAGNFFQRALLKEWDFFPFTNVEGFLPDNCWPKENFKLVVGKEGYEYKEINIPVEYDPTQLMQIKLNRGSNINCNFQNKLPLPISVGILNANGVLLQKPIPYINRKKKDLTIYYENISSGNISFNDLAAGTYSIGYFWNGSTRLISKQGPFTIGIGETINVASTLQLEGF